MNLFCTKHLPGYRRTICANGRTVHVVEVCLDCGAQLTPPGRWVPHEVLRREGMDVEALPVMADYRGQNPPCEVEDCAEPGTEEHHWAPKHLFKGEAGRWPRSWLCPKHHDEWHDRVTPEMSAVP